MTDRDDIRTRLGRLLMRWDQLDHQDTFDIDLLHHAVDSIELRHHWRTLTPAEIADRVRWFQDHAHRGGPSGMAIEHPTFTPTQTDIMEVIVTGAPDWLPGFTRQLVEERLVACGQHTIPIRSIYRWQGAIEDEPEARVALHTRAELIPTLIERIRKDHPYEVPCILAVAIADANPDYAKWVRTETAAAHVEAEA